MEKSFANMVANIRNAMYDNKALMAAMGRVVENLNGWRCSDE